MGSHETQFVPSGFGWRRDLQDFRDFTLFDRGDHPAAVEIDELTVALKNRFGGELPPDDAKLPNEADLRDFFGEVVDQGNINSSAACACVAIAEYFEKRSYGRTSNPSKLFLYNVARKQLRTTGDVGAEIRATLKAMVRCGLPPEEFWPYETDNWDRPAIDPFLYSFVRDYQSIRYLRLDGPNVSGRDTLKLVKTFIASGIPVLFGFAVPSSFSCDGNIRYRPFLDRVLGGQVVVAVGYDDSHMCPPRGALLVRSSWGIHWGEAGYGRLPYQFVEQQASADFWTFFQREWLQRCDIL